MTHKYDTRLQGRTAEELVQHFYQTDRDELAKAVIKAVKEEMDENNP